MNSKVFRKVALMWVVLLCIWNTSSSVQAATLTVNTLADDNSAGTLRSRIAMAGGSDIIDFGVSGTITLTRGEIQFKNNVSIVGPGASVLTISGQDTSNIFHNTGYSVRISGLTLAHGYRDAYGGAILNEGVLSISDCVVANNESNYGGGIANFATLTAVNCQFVNNRGGAFRSMMGTAVFNNCRIADNLAYEGGGIYGSSGTVTLNSSIVSGNSGSGIYMQAGTLTVNNSTINANSGGGISNNQAGRVIIRNTTITGNNSNGSSGQGGGISGTGSSSLEVSNSTIADNIARSYGGGISWFSSGRMVIGNTIIADNSASIGPDVYGPVSSKGYSLVGKNDGSTGFLSTDKTGTSAAPLDLKLGLLANNGGATQTMALLPGSPAIDAGNDSVLSLPLNFTTDQRGKGFARKHGAHVDSGAFEFNVAPVATTQSLTTTASNPLPISLAGADDDGDTLSYLIVNNPAAGTLQSMDGNQVTYIANAGFAGTDSFTFKVYDGTFYSDVATVFITVQRGLSISDVSRLEGNGASASFEFAVTLSAASAQTIEVNYAASDGSALAGSDYMITRGTLVFAPYKTTKSIVVPIIGDTNHELNETFRVNLSNPVNVAIAKAQGIGTIQNDDSIGRRGGKILFQSTRDGNNEVYAMNADGSHQTNLTNSPNNDRTPGWRPDGKRIVWSRGDESGNAGAEIWAMNADGTSPTPLTISGPERLQPDYSADGTRIAFSAFGGLDYDVYVMDADGNNLRRVVNNQLGDYYPRWSPDNANLLYSTFNYSQATYDYPPDVYRINADGSGNVRLTSSGDGTGSANADWSPDGTKIVFKSNRGGVDQIYIADADGSNPVRLTSNPYANYDPTFSPDGTSVAFTSTRDGSEEIYVMDISGANQTRLTTTGGSVPSWAPGDAPNRAAIAASQRVSTTINTPLAITLSGIDVDGDALTYNVVTPPAHGTLSGAAPALTYTPDSGYFGSDAFIFVANDGSVNSNRATVNIAVTEKVPPTVSIVTPQNGSGFKKLTVISGTAADEAGGSGLSKVDVYLRRTMSGAYQYWANRSGVWGWGASVTPVSTILATTGAWSVSNTSPAGTTLPSGEKLPSGSYQVFANALDKTGNATKSAINTFSVDAEAPATVVVSNPAHGAVVKTLPSISGTSSDNAGGSGIAKVDAYLRRTVSGAYQYWANRSGVWDWGASVTPIATTLGANNSWNVSNTSPTGTALPSGEKLPSGSYQVFANALDKAGNSKVSAFNAFNVDVEIPATVVVNNPAHAASLKSLVSITGTSSDNTGGSGMAKVDTYLRRTVNGAYEFWAKRSGVWGWGTSAPPLATTLVASGAWSVSNTSPPGTTLPSGANLPNGLYAVYAIGSDKMGNSRVSAVSTFLVDTTFPASVAVTSPASAARLSSLPSITGTSSDNAGGSGIGKVDAYLRRTVSGAYQYWANRAGVWDWGTSSTPIATTAAANGSWSVSNTAPAGTTLPSGAKLPSGSYQVFANALDKAGNSKVSAINTFSIISGGSTAVAEDATSSVILSSASAQAANDAVRLVFSGALDIALASDPGRYRVTLDGVAVAIESVRLDNSSTVALTLEEGNVALGDVLVVTYAIKDSKGLALEGQSKVTVK